jgi:hypothetical protein
VAIIAHGSSSGRAIRNAIRAAANEALVRNVNSEIVDVLAATPLSLIARPPSGRGIRGVLERMRERLHSGRDTHAPKRPEPPAEAAARREGIEGTRDSAVARAATSKTRPINPEALRSEATNNRKPSAEQAAMTNGQPSAAEPDQAESEQPDNGNRPAKPV